MVKKPIDPIDSVLKQPQLFQHSLLHWFETHPYESLIGFATLLGFFFRLFAIWRATGNIHPDEVFQSMEIAHLIVYGSGIKAPEFLDEFPSDPSYASSRSWVFPLIFAFIMKIGEALNLDYHEGIIPLIKFFVLVNATLLIPVIAKLSRQITKNSAVAVISAFFVAFWFRVYEYGVRNLTNTVLLPLLFFAIYRMLVVLETKKFLNRDYPTLAFGLGLVTYVRLDLGIIVFSFFLFTFSFSNLKQYLISGFMGALGWYIGIWVDYYYYGKLLSVPVNWVTFNIIEKKSDNFGVNPFDYYFQELIVLDRLLFLFYFSFIVFALNLIAQKVKLFTNNTQKYHSKNYSKLMLIFLVNFLIYSSIWRDMTLDKIKNYFLTGQYELPYSHKEIRFFMGALIVLLIVFSSSIVLFVEILIQLIVQNQFHKKTKALDSLSKDVLTLTKNVVYTIVIILFFFNSLQTSPDRYHKELFDDTNEAMRYIGEQDNVTGVMAIINWFDSGGYSQLHQPSNVEIRFLNFNGLSETEWNSNRARFYLWISNWDELNYILLPRFQVFSFPEVVDAMIEQNYQIDQVFNGKAEVWKLQES